MVKSAYAALLIGVLFLLSNQCLAEVHLDFDGDGKTDPTLQGFSLLDEQVFQIEWHILQSDAGYLTFPWGAGDLNAGGFSDFFVPADFDGDGKTDMAVWRRPLDSNAQCYFFVLYSASSTFEVVPWGNSPSTEYVDTPLPQEYDGDGSADIAIVRTNSQGLYYWIKQSSSNQLRVERFGLSGDVAARGDYDGDGKADLAVARESNQTSAAVYNFYIQNSSDGSLKTETIGLVQTDLLAPGDYDGDGKTDVAVWRGRTSEFSPGGWQWIRSSDGQQMFLNWGRARPNDFPAQGDYDGDGITDVAIFRPNQFRDCGVPSYFWINGSSTGLQVLQFGSCHAVIEFYF